MKYYITDVPAEQMIEVAEGAYQKGTMKLEDITEYLDVVKPYATRIVKMASQLGILEEQNGIYNVCSEAKDLAIASIDQRPFVFKKFLVDFEPFVLFCYYLLRENPLEDASRKVGVVCEVGATSKVISRALRGWGSYSKLLKETKEGIAVEMEEKKLEEIYVRELLKATQDVFNANLFIAYKVGDEIFDYLEKQDRHLLVEALTKYSQAPKDAINHSAQAFESFLRHFGQMKDVDLKRATGILQIACEFKGKSLILEEHRKMCEFLSAFRNPAGHGVSKEVLEHWAVEKDSSLEIVLLFLTAIRSYYRYGVHRELIL
jgi:hypothetical protein